MHKFNKNIFLLLFLFFILNQIVFADNSSFDFRKIRWGMTKQEVIYSETSNLPIYYDDNFIHYEEKLNSINCRLIYFFMDDYLTSAGYIFDGILWGEYALTIYEYYIPILTEKYGKPSKSEEKWDKQNNKTTRKFWGKAIENQELVLSTEWKTSRTIISITAERTEFGILVSINYSALNDERDKTKMSIQKKPDTSNL